MHILLKCKNIHSRLSLALNNTCTTSRSMHIAFFLHPSYIRVSFFKQILSPISTSLLSYVLSSSSFWLIFGMYYFLSLYLILNFLTTDCSICLVKDTSSSGWHFIIVHDDGLSQTKREATTPILAIKAEIQKKPAMICTWPRRWVSQYRDIHQPG